MKALRKALAATTLGVAAAAILLASTHSSPAFATTKMGVASTKSTDGIRQGYYVAIGVYVTNTMWIEEIVHPMPLVHKMSERRASLDS